MAEQRLPEQEVQKAIDDLVDRAIAALGDVELLTRVGSTFEGVTATAVKLLVSLLLKVSHPFLLGLAKGQIGAEEMSDPAYGELARLAIQDLFNVDIPAPRPGRTGSTGLDPNAARAVGRAILEGVTKAAPGSSGTLEPGTAGAEAFLGSMGQFALEGWLQGWMSEIRFVGQVETMAQLDDIMAETFGFGRVSSRVLRAALEPLAVTPMRWQINKNYRPELLSPALAVRHFLFRQKNRDALNEELARQGWSQDRIDALISDAQKRVSVEDLMYLHRSGHIGENVVLEQLAAMGYDDDNAGRELLIAEEKLRDRYRRQLVDAAIAAFASRDLDSVDLENALTTGIQDTAERQWLRLVADQRRELNVKRLSHSEIKEAVERGLLNRIDYRRWLEREGYAPEDAVVLELLLESTIRGQQEKEKRQREIEDERAAAKAAAEQERARRAAELAEKKAQTFAPLGDYERAVILGILPIDAYADRLAALKFAPADIAFEVELVQLAREKHVDDEERRAIAEAARPEKRLALAEARRAVLMDIIPIETYRDRLTAEQLPAGDVAIAVALLEGELADRRRAAEARALAAARLAERDLSLGQVERAVRQHLASLDDYGAFLRGQGFDQAEAALLVASLGQDIAAAEAEAQRRAEVNRRAALKGIGLAQIERAVKLGVRSLDYYADQLRELGVSTEDQVTLLAILRAELARLDAARKQRDAPGPGGAEKDLARRDMERAVLKGLQTLDDYHLFLGELGYGLDAADLLTELLLLELQSAQQGDSSEGP